MAAGCNKCGAKKSKKSAGNGKRLLTCPGKGCKAKYCSKECQTADWRVHRTVCQSFQSHTCWICKKSSTEDAPLYRSCQCRGEEGFGHLECFVRYAKMIDRKAFQKCPLCKGLFQDEVAATLTKEARNGVSSAEAIAATMGDKTQEVSLKLERAQLMLGQKALGQDGDSFDQVIEAFEEVYEFYRLQYGKENMFQHQDACVAAHGIASSKALLGRLEEALELLTALDDAIRSNPVPASWEEEFQHDMSLVIVETCIQLGRYEVALPRAKKLFDYLSSHPNTVFNVDQKVLAGRTLVVLYDALKNHEKALSLAKEMYELSKKTKGQSHTITIDLKRRIGRLEATMAANDNQDNKNELSLKMYEEQLAHYRMQYGKKDMLFHYEVVDYIVNMAIRMSNGDHSEFALKWLKKVDRVMRSGDSRVSWKDKIEHNLDMAFSLTYIFLKRFEDARPFAERSFARVKDMERSEDKLKDPVVAASQLVVVYQSLENRDKVDLQLEKEAHQLCVEEFGTDCPVWFFWVGWSLIVLIMGLYWAS